MNKFITIPITSSWNGEKFTALDESGNALKQYISVDHILSIKEESVDGNLINPHKGMSDCRYSGKIYTIITLSNDLQIRTFMRADEIINQIKSNKNII